MSIKEFWEEEPNLLWTYRKSYMDKIKLEENFRNQQAWLQGLYTYDAISVSLFNYFGRKETQQPIGYMKSPIDFDNIKSKEEIEKEEILKMEEQIKERNKQIKRVLEKKNKKVE